MSLRTHSASLPIPFDRGLRRLNSAKKISSLSCAEIATSPYRAPRNDKIGKGLHDIMSIRVSRAAATEISLGWFLKRLLL